MPAHAPGAAVPAEVTCGAAAAPAVSGSSHPFTWIGGAVAVAALALYLGVILRRRRL
jgi:hypothetical protein